MNLDNAISLELPTSAAAVRRLTAGDFVRLSGHIFTARDAAHRYLAEGGAAPCVLQGAVIYHCGPVVIKNPHGGWTVTAAGPTTSIREEPYMAEIIEKFGIRGIIGKGGMGTRTLAACQQFGCVYLHAVGGAAQVLATAIECVNNVWFEEEFGAPEAIWDLTVHDFPALVTMDARGNSLHAQVADESNRQKKLLCA